MLTPSDLRNPPRRHAFPRRGTKVPLRTVGLNGVNDDQYSEHEFLRPADPQPLHNDYAALLKYRPNLGEGEPVTFIEKAKAVAVRYKWPLIVGGVLAAGVVGYIVYKKRKG